MELEVFAEALDALVASGAANYGDCASIEELHRHLSRFEAFVTEVPTGGVRVWTSER